MKKILSLTWRFVKRWRKYVIATVVFLVFFLFLGENNIIVVNRLRSELAELNKEVDMLEENIQRDSIEAVSLIGDMDALETYGREHYYMKRDNEDIFIIKD